MANSPGLTDEQLDAEIAALQRSLSQPHSSGSNTAPGTRPPDYDSGQGVQLWMGGEGAPDPAQLSDEQLTQQLNELMNSRPMSTGEDMARSGVTGLEKGAASVAGMPGGILNLWGQGVDKGMSWLLEKTGQWTPEQAKAYREHESNRDYAADHGLTGPAKMNEVAQALAGPYHKPQTTAGKFTETIAEMAPNALGPGGPLRRLAQVVLPGAGSEAAGQLTEGTAAEPWARMGGAALGGGVAGAGAKLAGSPQALARQSVRGVDQSDLTAAGLLMHDAEKRGVKLTWAEAVQQVTGGASGAGRMQRVVEGTQPGQQHIAPMMAQRPGQVRGAVMDFADQIAPPTNQPSMIGVRGQRAGQGALDSVRQDINDTARPYYDALTGQSINPILGDVLKANPSYTAALKGIRSDPELGASIAHLPDDSVAVQNAVSKQLDTMATASRQTMQNPAGNNYLASARGEAKQAVDKIAGLASPDYTTARALVHNGREAFLDPLEAGPLGQVSKTENVPAQTAALYPTKPLEGAPAETAEALRNMGMVDPSVGPDLTRQHIVNTFNEASQDLQPGANQWGGAKFGATIAGNPEQGATLRAGLGEVAPNTDIDPLLQVLMATGKRQQPGSMTAFNAEDLKGFGQLPIPSPNALNPLQWPQMAKGALSDFQSRRNAQELAQSLLRGPDEVIPWLQRSQGQGMDADLVRALLLGTTAASSAQGGQP